MEERGFIRDMLDVKVLILFVAATAKYPLTLQKIYELCYQDDRLSYFDVSIAVPQMVESGHLEQLADETYVITEKGREQEDGSCAVRMYLRDDVGSLMKLELTAPSKTQGRVLQRAFEQKAEIIYNSVMKQLLQQEK